MSTVPLELLAALEPLLALLVLLVLLPPLEPHAATASAATARALADIGLRSLIPPPLLTPARLFDCAR